MQTSHRFLDETEAWNYAVGYFCSGIDYSRRPSGSHAVYPFNRQDLLELMVNGYEVVQDTRINTETGEVEEYYRGPKEGEKGHKAKLRRVGKWWVEQHVLNRQTLYYRSRHDCVARVGYHSYDKAHRKFPWAARFGIDGKVRRFPSVGWMLLGFDLDAKHGELDVGALRDWLLELFPGAYHEPSTGGSGIHLYVKLAYRVDHAGDLYATLLLIDRYVARLSAHLESRRVKRGIEAKLDQIRSTPTLFSRCSKSKRVVVAKRALCIKAPRCSRGLDDIFDFHVAPFVLFDGLVALVDRFDHEDALTLPELPLEAEDAVQNAYQTITKASDERNPEDDPLPLATSTTIYDHPPKGTGDFVRRLRAIPNTLTRKINFIYWQRRVTGHWDTVQGYINKYITLGASEDGIEDDKLRSDMAAVLTFCKTHYVERQDALGSDQFEQDKQHLLDDIAVRLRGQALTWKKEADRVRKIDPLYVAAVLHLIRRECELSSGRVSQRQLQERVRSLIGKKPHTDMIQSITNWLKAQKLIAKVANPIWGCGKHDRGTQWRALFPKPPQTAA